MAYYGEQFFESVDLIYRNSNWLERETSEMYNIYFKKKLDSRKLLLDYTIDINPMLKDYPSEGEYDCYFSNIENQVVLEKNQTVEL
jgi:NADH:ubiquinone oxidoreductase subunit C